MGPHTLCAYPSVFIHHSPARTNKEFLTPALAHSHACAHSLTLTLAAPLTHFAHCSRVPTHTHTRIVAITHSRATLTHSYHTRHRPPQIEDAQKTKAKTNKATRGWSGRPSQGPSAIHPLPFTSLCDIFPSHPHHHCTTPSPAVSLSSTAQPVKTAFRGTRHPTASVSVGHVFFASLNLGSRAEQGRAERAEQDRETRTERKTREARKTRKARNPRKERKTCRHRVYHLLVSKHHLLVSNHLLVSKQEHLVGVHFESCGIRLVILFQSCQPFPSRLNQSSPLCRPALSPRVRVPAPPQTLYTRLTPTDITYVQNMDTEIYTQEQ